MFEQLVAVAIFTVFRRSCYFLLKTTCFQGASSIVVTETHCASLLPGSELRYIVQYLQVRVRDAVSADALLNSGLSNCATCGPFNSTLLVLLFLLFRLLSFRVACLQVLALVTPRLNVVLCDIIVTPAYIKLIPQLDCIIFDRRGKHMRKITARIVLMSQSQVQQQMARLDRPEGDERNIFVASTICVVDTVPVPGPRVIALSPQGRAYCHCLDFETIRVFPTR